MKPTNYSPLRYGLIILGVVICIGLVSWGRNQQNQGYKPTDNTDTTPKKNTREKKVRDLDEALAELDNTDLDAEFSKARLEMEKAFRDIDPEKIRRQVEESLKQVDFSKAQAEMSEALAKLDCDKIKTEITNAMKELDLAKIKLSADQELAKVNWDKIKDELAAAKEEMKKAGPEMEKAKKEIEKAKITLTEYRDFVNGLDDDGLISKKEGYTIEHKDGELSINGKKAGAAVYEKYRNFLEKHKKFELKKSADDFSINE